MADINGDGKLDIILGSYSATSLLKNTSSPGFISLQQDYDFALTTTNASISDLNGDGKADICFGRPSSGNISLIENKYAGAGSLFGSNVDLKSGNFDTFVATGDLDGDGRPDLAATNTIMNTVTFYSNKIDAPSIDQLKDLSLKAGDTLHITGSNLARTTSVKLGGTEAASFKVINANSIDAVVGNGASGDVMVTTTKGAATYSGFQFIPVINVSGDTSVCDGMSVSLTSTADANNQWYVNDAPITGATSKTYAATITGKYTVKTTGNNVTTTSPLAVDITVTKVPTPTISRSGNILLSSATVGNQWYFNGKAIQSATAPSYQPSQSGDYTVQVSADDCVSAFSKAVSFTPKGMINLPNGQFINLYPNPITDKIVINCQLDNADALTLEIFDSNGRPIKTVQGLHSGDVVHLDDLPKGLFIIKISSKNGLLGSTKMFKVK
jgi:hypothetical protein